MDQATQQNAALVEEMAAAASSLKSQAQDLVQAVAVFKLTGQDSGSSVASSYRAATSAAPARRAPVSKQVAAARKPAVPARAPVSKLAAPKPVSKPASKSSSSEESDDWESF
jgi:hypothetical protein